MWIRKRIKELYSQDMVFLRGSQKGSRWDTSFIVASHISVFRSSRHCVKTHPVGYCFFVPRNNMCVPDVEPCCMLTPLSIVNHPGM